MSDNNTACEHFYSFNLCLKCGHSRSASTPAMNTASPSDLDPDGKFALGMLREVARMGASPAGLSLAAQLFGVGPCAACGYRKLYCRCAAPVGQGSANLDQQIAAVMAVPDDQLDGHLRSIGLDPGECEKAGASALDGAIATISGNQGSATSGEAVSLKQFDAWVAEVPNRIYRELTTTEQRIAYCAWADSRAALAASAEQSNTGSAHQDRLARIREHGDQDLIASVRAGSVSISEAVAIVDAGSARHGGNTWLRKESEFGLLVECDPSAPGAVLFAPVAERAAAPASVPEGGLVERIKQKVMGRLELRGLLTDVTPNNIRILGYELMGDLEGVLPKTSEVTDVRELVNRFLGWSLPKTFAPDCGISFKPVDHPNGWPIGTNLLTADEAKAMFEYALAAPEVAQPAAQGDLAKLTEYERSAPGSDGVPPYRVETFYLAADVRDLLATPAPTVAKSGAPGFVLVSIEPITGDNYTMGAWSRRNWQAAIEDQINGAAPMAGEASAD